MASYTWMTEQSNFVCSYDPAFPTIKDNIRFLVGDVNGLPVAYLADASIEAIAAQHGNDLYVSAAECAEACTSRALQLQEEIQQGTRFKIKNFDPVKAYNSFLALATMLRNKSTIGQLPSYGVLAGKICTPPNTRRITSQ